MRLGDLDALKEALHNFFDGKVIDEPAYILRDVFYHIDGAPTVTPDMAQVLAYESGKVGSERSTAEWEEEHEVSCGKILQMRVNVVEHKCNNCKRWGIKWAGTIPDNYCPNCGAKMKGGAE